MKLKRIPSNTELNLIQCLKFAKVLSIQYKDLEFIEYQPFDTDSWVVMLECGAEISKIADGRAVWFTKTVIGSDGVRIIILFGTISNIERKISTEINRLSKLIKIQKVLES